MQVNGGPVDRGKALAGEFRANQFPACRIEMRLHDAPTGTVGDARLVEITVKLQVQHVVAESIHPPAHLAHRRFVATGTSWFELQRREMPPQR